MTAGGGGHGNETQKVTNHQDHEAGAEAVCEMGRMLAGHVRSRQRLKSALTVRRGASSSGSAGTSRYTSHYGDANRGDMYWLGISISMSMTRVNRD